jgi:hypothetical protein
MTRIVFVADGKFADYHKLMWAAAVAIEEANSDDIEMVSLGSNSLHDVVTEYVGKVSPYLEGKGVTLKEVFVPLPDDYSTYLRDPKVGKLLDKDTAAVVVLTKLTYVPLKDFAARAKIKHIEVKTF